MALSGDVYAQGARFDQSVTSLADATYSNPGQITFIGTSPDLSARGLYIPRTGPAHLSHPQRYEPYRFLLDVDLAFDPASGDIYMGRAYQYPFDRGTWYYAAIAAALPATTSRPMRRPHLCNGGRRIPAPITARGSNPCRVTGVERNYVLAVP